RQSSAVIDATSMCPTIMNSAPEATKAVPRCLRLVSCVEDTPLMMSGRVASLLVASTISSTMTSALFSLP
ncbi:hypothetical protein M9458_003290, partial [Cirrhinus mrigala]